MNITRATAQVMEHNISDQRAQVTKLDFTALPDNRKVKQIFYISIIKKSHSNLKPSSHYKGEQ